MIYGVLIGIIMTLNHLYSCILIVFGYLSLSIFMQQSNVVLFLLYCRVFCQNTVYFSQWSLTEGIRWLGRDTSYIFSNS